MTARLSFTEHAMRRAIKAARKEGLPVTGTTIRPDGTITVHHGTDGVAPGPGHAQHARSSEFEEFEA
jgi:uncharacterized protein GlcG (DUF336 family)